MKPLRVRSKVWLEVDGEPVLGGGREQLLLLIDELGSINAAARRMGITFRRAWALIQSMEGSLAAPLVLREKGGAGGGRSVLTPEARILLKRFNSLCRGVNRIIDKKFAAAFPEEEDL